MTPMDPTEGNNWKTHGELLCLWTACGFLVDMTGGQWPEVKKKSGRQKERIRDTETEREKERAALLPLQSK